MFVWTRGQLPMATRFPATRPGPRTSGNNQLSASSSALRPPVSMFLFGLLGAVFLAAPVPSHAQVAAPGDVYYVADLFQKFKYYAFVNDEVIWEDNVYSGTSLQQDTQSDTTDVHGSISTHTSIFAEAGYFQADIGSQMTLSARTGVFHQAHADLTLDVYIRGATGTPYTITEDWSGTVDASRVGGVPGSLQGVNGTSEAYIEDFLAFVPNGGTASTTIDDFNVYSGNTTTQILVGTETYSLARKFVYTSRTSITQALCILGCMLEAADFNAVVDGHVTIGVYPYGDPTDVATLSRSVSPILLSASPNPAPGQSLISFQGRPGTPTTVELFDVQGRRVTQLFDARATGSTQTIPWDASNLPNGVYFLRLENGSEAKSTKLTLVK